MDIEDFLCRLNDVRREHTETLVDEADLVWDWLVSAVGLMTEGQIRELGWLVTQFPPEVLPPQARALLNEVADV
ncbi:hypothetical protein HNR62_000323 [Oceanisphaera litoralis]|uniref:hypothetical protein n=1 Tax=Oceanisphaera litoralis TaxID=225144 RepID=UPI00195E9F27|nr:hypothetical protein [Oceanisphaera litoralis]MBM7454494.1 hypothetical protein [Oceanisphaera litoralis]